jgi:large-conductance mechanosensitive channel
MSPLFCVALLLFIAILAVHSYKGLGTWWGYPLAISGLIGIALAMLVGPLSNFLTNTFLGNRTMAGISPVMIETGSDLAAQLIKSLFTQVRNYSVIAAGLGLGIIIISAVIKSPEKIESEKIDETESEEQEIEETDKVEAEPEESDIEETDSGEAEPEETENEESAAGKKEKEPEESDNEETEEGPE